MGSPTRYGAILVAASLCAACAALTRPDPKRSRASLPSAPLKPSEAVAAPGPNPPAPAMVQPAAAAAPEQIAASHILVAYRGATRTKPTVTRTRDEARALAQRLEAEARKPGTDFATLAQQVSDGPSGVEGGALPKFERREMVKAFADAAFGLQPGQISGVVETNFGFHIIKRTE